MLRISLFGPPNRRKQPERYAQLVENFSKNILTNQVGIIYNLENYQGVFMKEGILGFFTLFLIIGCVTVDPNVESFLLDQGIKQASDNIVENINAGTKLAALYFSSDSETLSEYIIEELSTNLINTKKFVVVDRKNLDQVRDELNLQMSGDVSDESAQSIGRFLGAQSIMTGSIQKIGNLYRLRFNTIAVETAERQASYSFYLSQKDRQAYSLITDKTLGSSAQMSFRQQKKSYFEGNGGSGIFLALSNNIETENITDEDVWLIPFIKGNIEHIIRAYSNIALLTRDQSAVKAQTEEWNYQVSGMVSDESALRIGQGIGAQYILTGTVIKMTNNDYSIKMIILNVESGMQNATYTKIFSLQDIRNETAIRKICYELFKQMGVIYTTIGEKAILGTK
jgi:curli biogenesis system outer membrane secretion channel CsgG